jgi:hypothetical protein
LRQFHCLNLGEGESIVWAIGRLAAYVYGLRRYCFSLFLPSRYHRFHAL